MKTLGIDIGTTTISAAVLEDEQFLASETRANGAFIPSALACAREQDVEKITQTALSVVQMLFERYPDIHSIGVTGQMHGILYVDADGNAVSPLYTWQDARGSLPHSKAESWVQYLTRETGCLAAVGFGLATHAYNLAAGLVPPAAVTCCTIGDYLAMRLCGLAAPRMDASNAASIGFFDAERRAFDQNALQKASIDSNFVPQLAAEPVIGHFRNAAVCAAIGDNQASFLRSVRDKTAMKEREIRHDFIPDTEFVVRVFEHAEVLDAAQRLGDAVNRRCVEFTAVHDRNGAGFCTSTGRHIEST